MENQAEKNAKTIESLKNGFYKHIETMGYIFSCIKDIDENLTELNKRIDVLEKKLRMTPSD